MSDITLSKAVRSNLLSLQNTAELMSSTQNRLATGKKVNSALDNPTNFFTASSLNSRAGDMNQLLDGMANGIQTLEAADNGLKAITKTLESMQSTLRQARQDKSFETASFNKLSGALSGTEQLSFSGGAIAGEGFTIDLTTTTGGTPTDARAAQITGTTALGPTQGSATGTVDLSTGFTIADNTEAFDIEITIDGDTANPFTVSFSETGGTDSDGVYTSDDILEAINAQLGEAATASFSETGELVITSASSGDSSSVAIDATGDGDNVLGLDGITPADGTDGGVDASGGDIVFSVSIDGGDAVEVTLATDGGAGGDGMYSMSDLEDAINAALADDGQEGTVAITADASGNIQIASALEGETSAVTITGAGAADLGFTDGDTDAGADAGNAGGTVTAKTIDALVNEINKAELSEGVANPLAGKIRASNDNGKLRIENLSTTALDITGASAGKMTGVTTGEQAATSEIGGNSVRAGLADQFNELRDQLDKIADDASFNGINLLRGDNLQITFNETGTSEINIQTKDAKSINSTNLGVQTTIEASQLDSDEAIDGFLKEIKGAINEVRSQSSAFGSNLSVVQNRQDFSKNMINTLQTGAANLTLADSNEEAANLLALQTRQQLSSTALSMASQADQAVLRLF